MAVRARNGSDQSSDRRNQILAIAARLFATRGYSATTVRDIADESGILSGSLYHHFASKEAIAQEILRTFLEGLIEQYEEILLTKKSGSDTFDELVRVSFNTIETQQAAVGLYQNESLFLQTQAGFEFLPEISLRIEQVWRGQIEQGQADGVFRDSLDPAALYRFIRDALWSTVRWFRVGGRHTAESLTATLLDLLHHGILADSKNVVRD